MRERMDAALADAIENKIGKGKVLSPWISPESDEHCALRHLVGEDSGKVAHRVAFIEKTPRVRVAGFTTWEEEGDKWAHGPKGCAPEYGHYPPSREWCDEMLTAMGYELTDKA